MKFDFYTERSITRYSASVAELFRYYLEYRLKFLGKDKPDFEDLQRARSKAIESCIIITAEDEAQLEFDAAFAQQNCEDDDPNNWLTPNELVRELQGCSQ